MTDAARVPFLDLITPHAQLESEFAAVLTRAIATAGFVGGPMVDEFERAFATFSGTAEAIGVATGTHALRFALIAAGIQFGDVVVTTPHTFIATTEAISQAGAHPEFVDIDERTYNIDPERLREYLEQGCTRDAAGRLVSRRSQRPVTGIVPVHLYGQVADMDAVLALADRFGLRVIEDACQAHGADYQSRAQGLWRRAGTMGHAAAFSFYPGKNLGALGEGGAVTTDDPTIARRIRMLRDHGQRQKYFHEVEGDNGRLHAIQAGFLHVKLPHLAAWNDARRMCAAEYRRLLQDVPGVAVPFEPDWSRAVYHLFVVRIATRDALIAYLNQAGIGTGIHYPIPLHLQDAYRSLRYRRGDFPITERVAAEIVSLPMFPGLTPVQQQRVASAVEAFVSDVSAAPLPSSL